MTMSREVAEQIAHLLNTQNQLTVPYTAARILEHDRYITTLDGSGKVIGAVEIKKVQWYQCEIDHVSVDPDFKRKGIGSGLLKEAEERARQLGARLTQCTIRVGNVESEGLFKKHGYVGTATFRNENSANDVTVYQKVLVPGSERAAARGVKMLPHEQLRAVLVPAYSPCPAFETACKGKMQWAPEEGHVPRGFAGGFGPPGDVRLVLVCAEPGNPYDDEKYPKGPPASVLKTVCRYVLTAREASKDLYHQNLRYILNGCFPGMEFRKQLERVWITNSVLCSAEREGGQVPAAVGHECRERYLEAQLRLFPTALVVALGRKAQQRLRTWRNVQPAYSVAPPGCHRREARPSWDAVIKRFRSQYPDLP